MIAFVAERHDVGAVAAALALAATELAGECCGSFEPFDDALEKGELIGGERVVEAVSTAGKRSELQCSVS